MSDVPPSRKIHVELIMSEVIDILNIKTIASESNYKYHLSYRFNRTEINVCVCVCADE